MSLLALAKPSCQTGFSLPEPAVATNFQFPTDPYVVTGYQFAEPVTARGGVRHLGEDIGLDPRTEVRAIADGNVIWACTGISGFAQVVVMEHKLSDGTFITSVYGHLSKHVDLPYAKPGFVTKGSIIGYVGFADENGEDGPHLHLGIRKGKHSSLPWVFYGRAGNGEDVDVDMSGNTIGGLFTNPTTFIRAHMFGAITITANLDGRTFGSASFTLSDPNNKPLSGVVLGIPVPNLAPGSYTLNFLGNPPANSSLTKILPCGILTRGPTCMATLNAGQTLTFTLQFTSNPPTAGFVMSSGNQSRTDGQTLNRSVTAGGASLVTFDARTRSTAFNGATIGGWTWIIDNTLVSTASNFQNSLFPGTHIISLVVTDSRGVRSLAVQGTVVVTALTSPKYTITEIPPLPGIGPMAPAAINNLGVVVGSCGVSNSIPCLYDGQIRDLSGALGNPGSGRALGVNNSDIIVGIRITDRGRAFIYNSRNGNVTDLDALIAGSTFSRAFNISDTNFIVGSTQLGPSTMIRPFVYNNGTITILDTRFGEAYGVNNSGTAIGYLFFGATYAHPFLYNGQMHDLGVLTNYQAGKATAINDAGKVVGYNLQAQFPYPTVPFLYDGQHMQSLSVLPGTTRSMANGINNLDQIVGTCDSQAVLWDNGTVVNLNSFLSPGSGWQLMTADAINDFGQIVGGGTLNGRNSSYLLTPQ